MRETRPVNERRRRESTGEKYDERAGEEQLENESRKSLSEPAAGLN